MKLTFVGADDFRKALQAKADVAHLGVLKAITPELIRAVDQAQRIIEFTISTADVDRQSDTIDVTGWDLMNYAKNPVVLFAHDQWNPPVAQALATWVEAGKLKSRAQFVERDVHPFGFMIFQLYVGGYMRATSVGFRPLEYSFAEDRKWGINFMRQELLEYSCVPVPANAEALMDAKAHGVELAPMKAWADRWLDETHKSAVPDDEKIRATLERMRALSDPTGRSLVLCMGDLKMPGCACDDAKCAGCKAIPGATVGCAGCEAVPDSAAATAKTAAAAAAKGPTATASDFPFACQHGHGHKTADQARDCDIVRVATPALPTGIKRLERFACDAGHDHATLVEAEACVNRAAALAAAQATLTALTPKEGRVLSRANEDRLSRANGLIGEVLSQLADADVVEDAATEAARKATEAAAATAAADTIEWEDDDVIELADEDDEIELSEDDVRSALREAILEQRMQLTGQVE